MRFGWASLMLILTCSASAGRLSAADGQVSFTRTSHRDFEKVAACAYAAMEKVHSGKIAFADAKADLSVRMIVRDTIPGPLGGSLYKEIAVTIAASGKGSTIDIVSNPSDPQSTWSVIERCAT